MIVQSLTKIKDGYEISIDETSYILEEEVILKYRLFEGKHIEKDALEDILKENRYEEYKKKALSYQIRYLKSSREVVLYLESKGIRTAIACQMVEELKTKHLMDDFSLAKGIASSLARNSNGPKMIAYKLRNRLFNEEIILKIVEEIDPDDYALGVEKLYKKGIQKYKKFDIFSQKQKIKNLFYQHGYPNIDLKGM